MSRGLDFSVRMGLNCGEVVVGAIGDPGFMDYTAQGPTVGLAARMEQLAEPGRIYLPGHMAKLVQGYFTLDEIGSFEVKGITTPVRVFELTGLGPLRTRFDRSQARGLSKFVGRGRELATLESTFERVCSGRGAVVGVIGEPRRGQEAGSASSSSSAPGARGVPVRRGARRVARPPSAAAASGRAAARLLRRHRARSTAGGAQQDRRRAALARSHAGARPVRHLRSARHRTKPVDAAALGRTARTAAPRRRRRLIHGNRTPGIILVEDLPLDRIRRPRRSSKR
jgi:hypothetical protein